MTNAISIDPGKFSIKQLAENKVVRLAIKGIAFLAAFLVVNLITNALYIRLVLSQSYLFRSEAQFEANKHSVQVLIAGDSHPMSAVDTRILPNSFSVTSTGENIIETYYRLQYYLERDRLDIKLVLLPVDLHSFSAFRTNRFESPVYWRKYINYGELGRYKGDLPGFLAQRLLSDYAYAGGITNTLDLFMVLSGSTEGLDPMVNGFRVKSGSFLENGNLENNALERAKVHLYRFDPFHADAEFFFLRTLDLLDAHDVKVALVWYPTSHEYYQAAASMMDVPAFSRQLDALLQGRRQAPPLLDYHDLFWEKEEYFDDPDHLNQAGASVFSTRLLRDLRHLQLYP